MSRRGIELARDALARGDVLVAYDAATAALRNDTQDHEARYLAALALVRSGADSRAISEIDRLRTAVDHGQLLSDELCEDIEALSARVAKDHALRSGDMEFLPCAAEAARRYERVADRYGRYYACVNAATLWCLAGDNERAMMLARRSIQLAKTSKPSYWALATQAEANLVLGDIDGANVALAQAVQAGRNDPAARATTHRQLKRLCDAVGRGHEVLSLLDLPLVLHYCGSIHPFPGIVQSAWEKLVSAEVVRFFSSNSVGFAYGALAAGADIIIAEQVLDSGAELHVVLPFSVEEFEETSVNIGGADWSARFRRCLDLSSSCVIACDSAHLDDRAMFGFASRIAMGHALNRARFIGIEAEQVAISDGRAWSSVAGTARDVEVWRRAAGVSHVINVKPQEASADPTLFTSSQESDCHAVIFADFHGFSRLRDEHYEPFISEVLGAIGQTLDSFGEDILYRNSWGDAIQLVLRDVVTAANCALALQHAHASLDLGSLGLPPDLGLRIAAHVGRLITRIDPIRGISGFWGREMTRAAQIEPRTPEGQVYATDSFAALLVLEPHSGFVCDYVGRVTTAKDFETIPMYRLRWRDG